MRRWTSLLVRVTVSALQYCRITQFHSAKDEDKRTGLSGHDVAAAVAIRERNLKERAQEVQGTREDTANDADVESDDEEHARLLKDSNAAAKIATTIASALDRTAQARAMSIDPLAPSSAFDETLRDRLREGRQKRKGDITAVREDEDEDDDGDEEEGAAAAREEGTSRGDERQLERNWRAPAGKRIAVPVRIEPKVYFAAERTFFVSRLVFLALSALFRRRLTDFAYMCRNGCTLASTSAQSRRHSLTSSRRATRWGSSAHGSSLRSPSSPSRTLRSSLCIARRASASVVLRVCTMTSMVRRCCQ